MQLAGLRFSMLSRPCGTTSLSLFIASFPEGEEFHVGEKAVEAGVGLASLSHETSEGDHLGGTGHFSMFVTLRTRGNKKLDTDTTIARPGEANTSRKLRIE